MSLKAAVQRAFHSDLVQDTNNAHVLIGQGEMARSGINKVGEAIAKSLGGEFHLAANKRYDAAIEKAVNKYDGRVDQVTDFTRGTVLIDTPRQAELAGRMLNPVHLSPFLQALNAKGVEIRDFSDRFENPTQRGWIGINMNPRIPFSARSGHIGEIQVIPRGMIPAYEETHKDYELLRAISRVSDNQALSPAQAAYVDLLEDKIKTTHRTAARDLGFGG